MNPIIIMLSDRPASGSPFCHFENDTMHDVYSALKRNRPADCELINSELMTQLLTIATQATRDSHVYVGRLPDGTELHFFRRVPAGMNAESISNQLFQKEPSLV